MPPPTHFKEKFDLSILKYYFGISPQKISILVSVIQIEFPKLIELLTRHPTFCSKDGCGMLSVLDIKSIQTVGVVLRIPFICGAGHKSFFDTSSQCENNASKYLLNQIEGFSISLSGVRLPQLKLYNILKGVPSYSYSSMKTTSTAYFKRVQTKEVKEEKFNRVRTEYIIKHLLLYVDRRCALMYLGSVEFSLGIAEKVVECSRKLPGFFGDIFVSALRLEMPSCSQSLRRLLK